MKKLLLGCLVFLLILPVAFAGPQPSCGGTISASSTSTSERLCGHRVMLVNNGPNEVYIRFNQTTATTSDFFLNTNESVTLDSDDSFQSVQAVCDTAETATVRYLSWK